MLNITTVLSMSQEDAASFAKLKGWNEESSLPLNEFIQSIIQLETDNILKDWKDSQIALGVEQSKADLANQFDQKISSALTITVDSQ